MSIYGTWLTIEHPDQWTAELEAHGVKAGLVGDFSEGREIGSPWVYEGSHVLPARTDRRGGGVDIAAIPNHITRDGRDDGAEGLHDWLRLSVDNDASTLQHDGEPYVPAGRSVVVLDRRQVEAMRDTFTAWLERSGEVDG